MEVACKLVHEDGEQCSEAARVCACAVGRVRSTSACEEEDLLVQGRSYGRCSKKLQQTDGSDSVISSSLVLFSLGRFKTRSSQVLGWMLRCAETSGPPTDIFYAGQIKQTCNKNLKANKTTVFSSAPARVGCSFSSLHIINVHVSIGPKEQQLNHSLKRSVSLSVLKAVCDSVSTCCDCHYSWLSAHTRPPRGICHITGST